MLTRRETVRRRFWRVLSAHREGKGRKRKEPEMREASADSESRKLRRRRGIQVSQEAALVVVVAFNMSGGSSDGL